jgi:hypothetical protein
MASILMGFGMLVTVGMIVGVEFGESGVEIVVAVGVNVDRMGVSVTGCGVATPHEDSRIDKATTAKNFFCIDLFLLGKFYQFCLNLK